MLPRLDSAALSYDVDFAIDEDVVELVATIADFFDRRDDARAIASTSATGAAIDALRWSALCDIGLPALRVAEPRGIGASLLDATTLAERFGAVLLPEPASASIVLAHAWDEHGGAPETLDDLLDGSRIASFAGFDRVALSADGTVSGEIRMMDDDVTDLIAAPAALALVLLDRSALKARGTRRDVDPSRPTVSCELADVVAVDVLRLTPEALDALTRELVVMTVSELVGGMQAVLTRTIDYVGERRQFGRSIGSFQAVKHQLADMYVATEQARAAVQFAAIGCDQGTDTAVSDVAAAARWVPRSAIDLFDKAIHLYGAMGYSWEIDVHLHLRRALEVRTLLRASSVMTSPTSDDRMLAS